MSQTAAALGCDTTPQSLEERFGEKAVETIFATLEEAVEQMDLLNCLPVVCGLPIWAIFLSRNWTS